jgi:Zn-dependent protease with chaperone function
MLRKPASARCAALPERSGPARRRPLARSLVASLLLGLVPAASSALGIANPEVFGKSAAATTEALTHYGAMDDAAALKRVADIGYRVAAAAGYESFPLSFFIVDMREPNAFALPGGQVFVTRGMLDLGLDDDELASLLGHEIAHVTLEHGMKMQRRAALLNALSSAVMVGVMLGANTSNDVPDNVPLYGPGPQSSGTSGAERIQGALAASLILSELLLRSYNREFEDQADEEGQRYAAAAGYSPFGGAGLFSTMRDRLPQSRNYGYWRTHPFYEERVGAAEARGKLLHVSPNPRPPEPYRTAAQEVLLGFEPRDPQHGEDIKRMLELAALTAWPQGPTAERLRLERLHRLRDAELDDPELERDYGSVVRAYEDEREAVVALTPESHFLRALDREIEEMDRQAGSFRGQADQVVAQGVYQTDFLEAYLSNYPDAADAPRLSFELAGAYARQGRQADAVERYVAAWKADPTGPIGERSLAGLRALATVVVDLATLQGLVEELADPELARVGNERLAQLAGTYKDLAVGADYLRQFPEGPHAEQVATRLDGLADGLYGEVVLYQGVGDTMKALDRMQQILTHAPLSPAADRLRERAVLEG